MAISTSVLPRDTSGECVLQFLVSYRELLVCLFVYLFIYLLVLPEGTEYEIDNYQEIITLLFSFSGLLTSWYSNQASHPLPHILRVWRAPKSPANIFLCLGGFKLFSLQTLCEQYDYDGVLWLLTFLESEFGFGHCSLG